MTLASLERALPPGSLLLLDTTTIASYFKGNEAVSPVATHIIDRFVSGGRNPAVVSTVTAMELLVSPLREQDDVLYRHLVFFLTYTSNLKMVDIDFHVAQVAAGLRALYNFKTPDSLIMAAGQAHSARYFVCNDSEWKRKLSPPPSLHIHVCQISDHLPLS